MLQQFTVLAGGGDLDCRGGEHLRNEQPLLRNLPLIELALQLLVHDALVRGVHVDNDQSALVLGQDVDAGELGDCKAEGHVG